jgi:broad specificity phosphatase PhoE
MASNEHTILIRHLNDLEDLSLPDRDGSIDPTELIHVPRQTEIVLNALEASGSNRLQLFTSPRLRTMQTMSAVVHEIQRINPFVEVELVQDERLVSLYHGSANLPEGYMPGDKFLPEKTGLSAWIKEIFEHGNLLYHFGDPYLTESGPKYPELLGQYRSYGESRSEFLLRVYDFLLDSFKSEPQPCTLQVVCSHIPVIMEVCAIVKLGKQIDEQLLKGLPMGALAFTHWDGSLVQAANEPVYTIVTDLSGIRRYMSLVEVERDYLEAIQVQSFR